MNCFAKSLKKGIIRISRHEEMPQNHLERYGIITVPKEEPVDDVKIGDGKITLPTGKVIEFTTRPDTDNDFWKKEIDYHNEKFRDKIPSSRIEGRPDEVLPPEYDVLSGEYSDKHFGISIKIDDDELFYGLGEGSRDSIQLRGGSYQNWAIYTFDEIPIPLVYSNQNWGLFIAAEGRHFVDIDDLAKGRLTVDGNFDELDVYLLYGDTMKDIIRLYTDITGRSMLLPKWAYGLTYIAQIHQNQFEILDDMMKFRKMHIPCDNVSLEPGWMTKFYDYSFDKDWDLTKFHIAPWMRKRGFEQHFIAALNRFGFHLALWMCMDYDLCDEEERIVTGEGKIRAWYDHVKPFIESGVDGLKIDPADMLMRIDPNKIYTNGESELAMHNVSQPLVMKQMHNGFAEQMNLRPYIHYSGGYTGQQRWGAATTGDTGGREGTMIWLQNLAMSGFMNSTVDMEIFSIESIHFAMLAPWAHHNAWSGVRQPWYVGGDNEQAYIDYARLRYHIIPYIYSAALECHETGVPMLRPMPLEYQDDPNCAELCHQYMIGESILISSFTDTIYLPEGTWIDNWTGEEFTGPYTIEGYKPPKCRGGAMFIKKGAIIPSWKDRDYTSQYTDEEIILDIYPYGKSECIFREDDGVTLDYIDHTSCHTKITCEETEDKIKLVIGDRVGEYNDKPAERIWKVNIIGNDKPVEVICEEAGARFEIIKN